MTKQTTLADLNKVGLLRDLKKSFEKDYPYSLVMVPRDNPLNRHQENETIWSFIENAVDKALKQQRAEVLEVIEGLKTKRPHYASIYQTTDCDESCLIGGKMCNHLARNQILNQLLSQLNTLSGDTKEVEK